VTWYCARLGFLRDCPSTLIVILMSSDNPSRKAISKQKTSDAQKRKAAVPTAPTIKHRRMTTQDLNLQVRILSIVMIVMPVQERSSSFYVQPPPRIPQDLLNIEDSLSPNSPSASSSSHASLRSLTAESSSSPEGLTSNIVTTNRQTMHSINEHITEAYLNSVHDISPAMRSALVKFANLPPEAREL